MTVRMIPTALAAAGMLLATPGLALAHSHDHGGGSGKSDKMECCEEGAACCEMEDGEGMACCEGEGMDEKPHGHGDKHKDHGDKGHGMRGHRGMRGHHGMRGHMGMMMHPGFGKGMEIRYMPAVGTATNQHLMLASGAQFRVNDWFTMGMQNNLGIQLFPQNAGSWLSPYGGILPKVGVSVGDARLDVGTLLGLGGMVRTGGVAGMPSVVEGRVMWVAEPRVEIGMNTEHLGVSLVGTYLITPNMNDLGGFSVGVRLTGKGGRK